MKSIRNNKGSLTVEASIVLPIFFCAILTIVLIIKVFHTYEITKHALYETSNELSNYVYLHQGIYSAPSLNDFNNQDISKYFNYSDTLFSAKEPYQESIKKSLAIIMNSDDLTTQNSKNALKDLIKYIFLKHISDSNSEDNINLKLKKLNIFKGLEGIDLSKSNFYEEDRIINIVLNYKIKLLSSIKTPICQKISIRPWLNGDNSNKAHSILDEHIWDLPDLERGKRFQDAFGRNLPDNFPIICRLENGIAYKISSIDIYANSYKKTSVLKNRIKQLIDEFYEFHSEKYNDIQINSSDIKEKKLMIIIPKSTNQYSKDLFQLIKDMTSYASKKSIILKIKYYGKKS